MMHILALSDLHGYLPEIPPCDLLLLGGDYCPTRNLEQERRFLLGSFSEWLSRIPARFIVGIAGNHDFILQEDPSIVEHMPWIYLQDKEVNLEGVRIYGTPWSLQFCDWAFMGTERQLREKYSKIPKNLDILLTHGPAYRHLDKTQDGKHVGSFSLLEKINEVKPDSVVSGHIHEARGIMEREDTRYFNVTHVNLQY